MFSYEQTKKSNKKRKRKRRIFFICNNLASPEELGQFYIKGRCPQRGEIDGDPFFIRRIKDEVRTVREKLYLGQAYWSQSQNTKDFLISYFALCG